MQVRMEIDDVTGTTTDCNHRFCEYYFIKMCYIKILDYFSGDFHRSQGNEKLDQTNSWKTSFKIIKLVFALLKLATLLFLLVWTGV